MADDRRLKSRLYGLDCANAYAQWFDGKGNMTPDQRAEAQKRYEESMRRSYEARFGRTKR